MKQKHVRSTITKLCLFFNAICAKTVDVHKLKEIQALRLSLCWKRKTKGGFGFPTSSLFLTTPLIYLSNTSFYMTNRLI